MIVAMGAMIVAMPGLVLVVGRPTAIVIILACSSLES
jgi:hypothetical protein